MGLSALDLISLTPAEQAAALLAFMAHPDSARDRAAWLELHADVTDAAALFDAVRSLPHAERLPVWEQLAGALARAPLETRQELVSDARELLRVGGRVSMLRKLLWVCQRHVLTGQAPMANSPQGAKAPPPERLDIAQALAACCFAAWIAESIPQPELTLDLSDATSANERWWQTVTARWREQHGDKSLGLPRREKVDADLALRSLRLLQSLSPEQAAGLLSQWVDAALQLAPPDTPLHPAAADVLRLTANVLNVGMPGALSVLYNDAPPAALAPTPTAPPAVPSAPLVAELPPAAVQRYGRHEGEATMPAPLRPVAPPPAPAPPVAAPTSAPTEPMPLSPMDRPFGAVSRPAEVAFVFKASLLHLPGDPDYPPSDSTDAQTDEPVPPSRRRPA